MSSRSSSRAVLLGAFGCLAAAACSDSSNDPGTPFAGFRVINATGGPIDVSVDGQQALQALATGTVSPLFIDLPVGQHQVHVQSTGSGSTDLTVTGEAGRIVTTYAIPGAASTITANVLADTGAVVPAGKSKLRLVHLASSAPELESWRTQPDAQTPSHVMTPFAYQSASPYLQSDAGDWKVWVTAPGDTTALATTGTVNVPDGERRTVVLVDSAGVLRLRVLEN